MKRAATNERRRSDHANPFGITRLAAATLATAALLIPGCDGGDGGRTAAIEEGREVFRHDTFGDEAFWTGTLGMHQAIQSSVDPVTALAVGLKVDSEAVPAGVLQTADLRSPATTVALLKLDAIVGLRGTVTTVDGRDTLTSVGTTCALCHSTVDDSVQKGIGKRLDGWPNRDLDPGAIIALSPALTAEQKAVLVGTRPVRPPLQP